MALPTPDLDAVPRSEVARLLEGYLDGQIPGDRLKSELYVRGWIRRAKRALEDDAARLQGRDPERFAQLQRILASDGGGVGAFV